MNTGTVKFFNEAKGFGFIKDDETEKEYFVHVSDLIDKIRENDHVTYDLREGRKGRRKHLLCQPGISRVLQE